MRAEHWGGYLQAAGIIEEDGSFSDRLETDVTFAFSNGKSAVVTVENAKASMIKLWFLSINDDGHVRVYYLEDLVRVDYNAGPS